MKRLNLFIISATLMLTIAACGGGSSIDSAISQIEKAVDKIEKNKDNMTKEELEALSVEMEAPLQVLNDALDNSDMGVMQVVKTTAALTRWGVVAAQVGLNELEEETGMSLEEMGDELVKSAGEGMSELEKTTGTSLEDLSKEMEKSGKELEDAVKELQKALGQ